LEDRLHDIKCVCTLLAEIMLYPFGNLGTVKQ
jgi:hypothetical protein